jgi:hypothetical protein
LGGDRDGMGEDDAVSIRGRGGERVFPPSQWHMVGDEAVAVDDDGDADTVDCQDGTSSRFQMIRQGSWRSGMADTIGGLPIPLMRQTSGRPSRRFGGVL